MNHVRSLGRRLGLVGVAVVVALIPMTAVPLATAQAQPATSADLAVTMRWIGDGTPRAKVGETASFAITVTNRGPDTAVNTLLSIGLPDQLNPISLTCSDPAACTLPGLDLPPGATVTATIAPSGTKSSSDWRLTSSSTPIARSSSRVRRWKMRRPGQRRSAPHTFHDQRGDAVPGQERGRRHPDQPAARDHNRGIHPVLIPPRHDNSIPHSGPWIRASSRSDVWRCTLVSWLKQHVSC